MTSKSREEVEETAAADNRCPVPPRSTAVAVAAASAAARSLSTFELQWAAGACTGRGSGSSAHYPFTTRLDKAMKAPELARLRPSIDAFRQAAQESLRPPSGGNLLWPSWGPGGLAKRA